MQELSMAQNQVDPAVEKLAGDIVSQCRSRLMMAYRFMNRALWKLPLETGFPSAGLCTTGSTLYLNPSLVIKRFRQSPDELARDLLHACLHCVFRQPFDRQHQGSESWGLACDIFVESVALEMARGSFPSDADRERAKALASLKRELGEGRFGPLAITELLEEGDSQLRAGYARLFTRDDHAGWRNFMPQEADSKDGGPKQEQDPYAQELEGESEEDGSQQEGESPDADDGESSKNLPDEGGEGDSPTQDEEESREWEEISKEIEAQLDSFGDEAADAALLMLGLQRANRARVDYRDFLRRFSAASEEMKVNDDEFDYIFYTFGLQRYGNMPLVEPLEYQETQRVRDFAVVIDTSGSTQGELVEGFVRRTCEILGENQSFGSRVNIHIIQCDARVQSDVVIGSLGELDDYLADFTMLGGGGTDFRPPFELIARKIREGELEKLQGMIYFTDGMGTYPTAPPPFKCAFVFMEDGCGVRKVPPWAMKVVMDEYEVREL